MELLAKQGIGTEPIENSMVVANMIGEYPYYEALDLLPSPDKNIKDLDAELMRLVKEGLKERGLADKPEYVERAKAELQVIKDKGFATYFLILADVIRWIREQRIFIGPGRGSGVSSLVCYSLYATNIDPLPYNLLFFRFLDPDRDDWPDVDIDIEVDRRYEVKGYVNRKYGHTANIMTFNYFRGKAAIKAAASVFKIPTGEVNKATSMLSDDAEYSIIDMYEKSDSTADFRRKYPEVLPLARELEGRIRGIGMHAGGTLISKEPIENFVPMQTANDTQDEAKARIPVAGIDMKDADKIGLIKYDFLGLNNLTVIVDTINAIHEKTGERIDPYQIPLDDAGVYEMLSQGHTRAVFQCEGGPYTKMLVKMGGVDNFEDLISSNALVRPGAANSSIGANFIRGKETGNFKFIHKDTESFTRETYGQILFQEQQMLLCTEVAGLSMNDANKVRRAISKKIMADLVVWKPAFIEGAAKKIGEKRAEQVWDDLEKSAEYAFNRAHSVGYSMISYWTAWFKLNHPVEYMTSVLNHVSGTDSKIKTLFYLMETKRLGINVKLPHVNASDVKNRVEGDSIRMGLESIKGIAAKGANKIIDNAPYDSYEHLMTVSKTKGSGINATAIKALNLIGGAAFEDNPRSGNERDNFYEYLSIPSFEAKDLPTRVKLQFRNLEEFTEDEAFVVCGMVYNVKVGTGWALVEMVDETGTAGAFASQNIQVEKGKMYVMLISNNRIARFITTDEIINGDGGNLGKFLDKERLELEEGQYRCIYYRPRTTKSGSRMADAIFTDAEKNLVPCMVFESMLHKADIICATASKCRPVFAETRSGATYLKEFE